MLVVKVYVQRLNLIVVSCGESFVTIDEWICTTSQVYTRVIVSISSLKESATEIENAI